MKRDLLTQVRDHQQLKMLVKSQRELDSLDGTVTNSIQSHKPDHITDYLSIMKELERIYQNMESNTPPNIIADPRARTSQIQLDNSVMWFPSSGTHYYLPFRHVVRAYAPQDLIDQLKAPRFSVLGANGRINGGFEKNGIYHSFGGIELLLPPAVIFAEAAELTFESNYCAKVSAGNGAIRRYKNGTFTLEGAIIIITEMVGPSASKNFRIGFYGHLPSNPITPQNQIAYSSGY